MCCKILTIIFDPCSKCFVEPSSSNARQALLLLSSLPAARSKGKRGVDRSMTQGLRQLFLLDELVDGLSAFNTDESLVEACVEVS